MPFARIESPRELRETRVDFSVASVVKNQQRYSYFGSSFSEAELMQYRSPVGRGPSGNTCPRCPPQRAQCTSVRAMPRVRSVVVPTALGRGAKKLGQPVPLSNFVDDSNSGRPQAAQAYMPGRCSWLSGLVPARSVPCLRMTEKVSGGNSFFHSSSERLMGDSGLSFMGTSSSSSRCDYSSASAYSCARGMSSLAISEVHPDWCDAPTPRPVSPWKYS